MADVQQQPSPPPQLSQQQQQRSSPRKLCRPGMTDRTNSSKFNLSSSSSQQAPLERKGNFDTQPQSQPQPQPQQRTSNHSPGRMMQQQQQQQQQQQRPKHHPAMARLASGRFQPSSNTNNPKISLKRPPRLSGKEEEETLPTTAATLSEDEEDDDEDYEEETEDEQLMEDFYNDDEETTTGESVHPLMLGARKTFNPYDAFAPLEIPEEEDEPQQPKNNNRKAAKVLPPRPPLLLQPKQPEEQPLRPAFKKTDSFKKRKQRAQQTQILASQNTQNVIPATPLQYWNMSAGTTTTPTPTTTTTTNPRHSFSDSSFVVDRTRHRTSHVDLLLNNNNDEEEDETDTAEGGDEPRFLQKIPERKPNTSLPPQVSSFPLSPTRRNKNIAPGDALPQSKYPPILSNNYSSSSSRKSLKSRGDESLSSTSTAPSTVRSAASSVVSNSSPSVSPAGRAAGSIIMTPVSRTTISPKSPTKQKIGMSGAAVPQVQSLDGESTHKTKKTTKKKKPAPPSRKVRFAPDGIIAPQKKEGIHDGPKLITLYWFEKQEEEQPKPSLLDITLEQGRKQSPEATRKSLLLDEYSIGKDHEADDTSVASDSTTDSTIQFLESHLDETTWADCRLTLTKLYFAHDKDPEERDSICEKTMKQLENLYDFVGSLKEQHNRRAAATGNNEEHTLRGLESSLCPQVIETLRVRHMENVLKVKLAPPKQVRAASLQTSRPFRFVAWQMAKYDTHIALVSVLQSWKPQ